MITSRRELIKALQSYSTPFAEEENFIAQFLWLLEDERCYHRDHLPGHITGSAFILDESRNFTLLTHHAKLNKWLQPGGHADGDENIFNVALREAKEETGLKDFVPQGSGLFDIDIHVIPERKDFPEHLHYDVRILLYASREENYTISEESNDLAWVSLTDVNPITKNDSLFRMVKKVLSL
jgi:8-oxo-dGTP pyrophosphatase MutT (NUDIX family)